MANRYVAGASGLPFAVLRGYLGTDLLDAHRHDRSRSLPVHRRGADRRAGAQPGRRDHPRPAGRPRRQRPALGHHRRAEGGGAGAPARRWSPSRRSSTSSSRGPARSCCPAGRSTAVAEVPGGAHPSYAAGLLRPRQRLLPGLGRDQPRPRRVRALDATENVLAEAERRVTRRPRLRRADEMMTVAAARALRRRHGLLRRHRPAQHGGQPRPRARTHPDLVLVYESGTIGAKPTRLPLSIGDGELAETADAVVSRARDLQLLAPARPDRRRLPRRRPDRPLRQHQHHRDRRLRRPRRSGCPAPAARPRSPRRCGEVIVVVRQTPRTFVERVDFVTSVGLRRRARRPGAARPARRGPAHGHHRPRRARARPGDRAS